MGFALCCDVCGEKFLRDVSKFCADCGEKRMEQGLVQEEDVLEVEEGNMRGPSAQLALQEKNVNKLSYLQVFAPPSCRSQNKKYGKKALLAANMGIQHRIMLDNYEKVKKWVVNAQEDGRLPQGAFSLEEQGMQDRLRQIVRENCNTLQKMKLGRKNHKWGEREIYKYLKQHLRYLRKKERNLEKLTKNEGQREELNSSPTNENRELFLVDTVETHEPNVEPLHSVEDDESFLLLVLSLPTVDVMRKHLKKVMEDINRRVTPKPFGKGYRKWDMDTKVREVTKYYRK